MHIKATIVAYAFSVQCFENATIVAYAGLRVKLNIRLKSYLILQCPLYVKGFVVYFSFFRQSIIF